MRPRSPLPRKAVVEGDMKTDINPFWSGKNANQYSRSQRVVSTASAIRGLALSFVCAAIFTMPAAAQTVRVISVDVSDDIRLPQQVKFFCTDDYNLDDCKSHVLLLRRELAMYPIEQLGSWSFVLGSSDSCRELIDSLGGNAGSPAFTVIEQRTTVFEQALFLASATRRAELLKMFSVGGYELLRLAVSHELGHALCSEQDEHLADDHGRKLRAGAIPTCKPLH